jgi:hypothetical protein
LRTFMGLDWFGATSSTPNRWPADWHIRGAATALSALTRGGQPRQLTPTAAREQCMKNSCNNCPPPTWPRNRRHRFSIDFREEIYYSTAMRRAIAIVARRMLRPNRKEVGRKG